MFEEEQIIADCRAALDETDAQAAIDEIVKKAVSAPAEIMRALGQPQLAGVETVYRAPDRTILNLHWGPRMDLFPHDHRMWAVIGIYGGREDNTFYRRSDDDMLQVRTDILSQNLPYDIDIIKAFGPVLRDQRNAPGVLEHMGNVDAPQACIEWHENRAEARHRKLCDHPFDSVGHPERDTITGLDAKRL